MRIPVERSCCSVASTSSARRPRRSAQRCDSALQRVTGPLTSAGCGRRSLHMTLEVIDALPVAAYGVVHRRRARRHRRRQMKALMKTVLVLAGCVCFGPVFAEPPKAAAEAASVAETIKQSVRGWCDAMIVVDYDKLNRLIADDWTENYPGKGATKSSFLEAVRSGKHKLE